MCVKWNTGRVQMSGAHKLIMKYWNMHVNNVTAASWCLRHRVYVIGLN